MYKVTLNNDGEETDIHHPAFNNLKLPNGQIKHGINIADGFTFSILPNNPGYHIIRPLRTLITVKNTLTEKLEFEGRILMPTESMSDSGAFTKAFLCEGELAYLEDSSQRHGEYHGITVKEFLEIIIDNHNADISDDDIDKKFVVGIVNVNSSTDTLYRYLGYGKTIDEIKDKLIDRLGGELRVRKENGIRYLDYVQHNGEVKQTEIRLAKNLKSIVKETDPTDIITRLIPLGTTIKSDDEEATDASQARLTIKSVNNGKDYIDDEQAVKMFGVNAKSVVWDDITQPSILKTRGQQHIQENNRVKIQHQITALDLYILGKDPDSFEVGNWHPTINPVMGINESLRIIGKTTDIINSNQNNLTIGDKFKTASQYQKESNKAQENVVELKNTVLRQSEKIGSISVDLTNAKEELQQTQLQLANFEDITDQDIVAITNSINTILGSIEQLEDLINEIPSTGLAWFDQDGLMSMDDFRKLYYISQSVTASKPDFLFYDFGVYISYAFQEFDKEQAPGSGQREGYYQLLNLLEKMARKIDEYETRITTLEGGA